MHTPTIFGLVLKLEYVAMSDSSCILISLGSILLFYSMLSPRLFVMIGGSIFGYLLLFFGFSAARIAEQHRRLQEVFGSEGD